MKRISRILLLAVALTSTLFLMRCASESKMTSAISPAFESFDVGYNTYTVNGKTGGEITLENGTKITIPANAFADANGETIEGEVTLKYREFHRPEDIIAGGIPMEHTENGESGHLITAGMMELRGTYQGEEINIAANKEINFEMASYLDEPGVNFYALDEVTGEWTEIGTPSALKNPTIDSLEAAIALCEQIERPIAPKKFDPEEPVIQLSSRTRVFKGLGSNVWRYAGEDPALDPFQYEAFKKDQFKIIRHEIVDKELGIMEIELQFLDGNDQIVEMKTASFDKINTVDLVNQGVRRGETIADSSGRKLITWFAPVLTGAAFEKSMDIYKEKDAYFEEQARKKAELVAMKNSTRKVSRSFSVSGFGFFNCDIFSREPSTNSTYEIVMAGTTVDYPVEVFIVNRFGSRESVLRNTYAPGDPNTLRLLSTGSNSLLFVMPGDQVATVPTKKLKELLMDDGDHLKFVLNDIETIGSIKDLGTLLAQI